VNSLLEIASGGNDLFSTPMHLTTFRCTFNLLKLVCVCVYNLPCGWKQLTEKVFLWWCIGKEYMSRGSYFFVTLLHNELNSSSWNNRFL